MIVSKVIDGLSEALERFGRPMSGDLQLTPQAKASGDNRSSLRVVGIEGQ